jgi:hypothetical protein
LPKKKIARREKATGVQLPHENMWVESAVDSERQGNWSGASFQKTGKIRNQNKGQALCADFRPPD